MLILFKYVPKAATTEKKCTCGCHTGKGCGCGFVPCCSNSGDQYVGRDLRAVVEEALRDEKISCFGMKLF